MLAIPNRKALEAMKRSDLQKIAKDHGLKANQKTEVLVDMLWDVSKTKISQPKPTTSPRTLRQGPTRIPGQTQTRESSILIHQSEEEAEDEPGADLDENPSIPTPDRPPENDEVVPEPPLPLPPRTRKAKDMQTRLGVGRPTAAGGSGARVATKSVSVSRGSRQSKSSRNVTARPVQETIVEEEPEADESAASEHEPLSPHAGTSTAVTRGPLDEVLADAIRPLNQRLRSLQSEVDHLKIQAAAAEAAAEGFRLQIGTITAELVALRSQSNSGPSRLSGWGLPITPANSTHMPAPKTPGPIQSPAKIAGTGVSSPTINERKLPSANSSGSQTVHATSSGAIQPLPHPGIAATTLGKRHRDSGISTMSPGIMEEDNAWAVARPVKKRPRLNGEDDEDADELIAAPEPPRPSNFTIFTDPENNAAASSSSYVDPPPPTNHLPDYFGAPSSAQGAENQSSTFNFAFGPHTSTPVFQGAGSSTFPYPARPQSPSPSPERRSGSGGQGSSNPAVLGAGSSTTTSSLDQAPMINGGAINTFDTQNLGLQFGFEGLDSDIATGANKPMTMYGTELDNDSRFGDFGVDGVAQNFWAGGGRY